MTKTLGTAYIDIEPRIGSFLAPQVFVELPLAYADDGAFASVNIAAIAAVSDAEPGEFGSKVLLSSGVTIHSEMERLAVLERMAEIHRKAEAES